MISIKNFCIIFALTLLSFAFADSTVWVRAQGSGWGSSDYWACQDAERDSERALQSECRWHANGNSYSLGFPHFTPCNCFESGGGTSFRCYTDGDAQCRIYD